MTHETPTYEHPAAQAKPKITLHPPTPELLRDLAGRLSADDLAELEAVGMSDPLRTLTERRCTPPYSISCTRATSARSVG
jgi:hypothetical protein